MLTCRNVENLRWALRHNIDNTFRRFGSELDAQLLAGITALHGGIRSALNKRQGESPTIAAEVERLSAAALMTVQARLELAGRPVVMLS